MRGKQLEPAVVASVKVKRQGSHLETFSGEVIDLIECFQQLPGSIGNRDGMFFLRIKKEA